MMTALSFGLLCFSSLLTVIDPLAAAPVFASITRGQAGASARRIALRACLVSLGVLVVFAVGGAFLFKLFGITIDAFRIAGGIVFVLLGLPMLSGTHEEKHATEGSDDPAVAPLAVPLISGPGAITTTMILMGQSPGGLHTTAFFVALFLALLVTFVVLALSPFILGKLKKSSLVLITKVMGLIVLVIGVQLIIDGVRPVILDVLRTASS
jgi:multiple antibiotic resistance protein